MLSCIKTCPQQKKTAHSIAGSSANMGATLLAATARSLEELAAAGNLGGAAALNTDIASHSRQTLDALRRLSTPENVSTVPG